MEITKTEETRGYYLQAMTYWVAFLKHGEDSAIAKQEAAILNAYEADAKATGVPDYELALLKATARERVEHGHR